MRLNGCRFASPAIYTTGARDLVGCASDDREPLSDRVVPPVPPVQPPVRLSDLRCPWCHQPHALADCPSRPARLSLGSALTFALAALSRPGRVWE